MKVFYLFLGLLVASACSKKKDKVTDNPPQEKVEVIIDTSFVVPDSNLVYSVVIRAYDEGLAYRVNTVIDDLNKAYENSEISFELAKIIVEDMPEMNQLTQDNYELYYQLCDIYDFDSLLSIWVVPSGDVCEEYSCSATKGFSNINGFPKNIVVSNLGWRNSDVIIHEMGHWFGLNHTTDDKLEDTPYDPSVLYEIYVSEDDCEMYHPDPSIRPMINNYMSYYKPCKFKARQFSQMQIDLVKYVAWTDKFKYAFSAKDYEDI